MSGTFVAIVGPSGAGKDSLIDHARQRFADVSGFRFVRRVVTRPADRQSEDHDTLDDAAFERAVADGRFALWWRAHGLSYGIPSLADDWIATGDTVVANLSRGAVRAAGVRYARMRVVAIGAEPGILAARLAARGREADAQALAARLEREASFDTGGCPVDRIDNSGELAAAGERLVALLTATRAPPRR